MIPRDLKFVNTFETVIFSFLLTSMLSVSQTAPIAAPDPLQGDTGPNSNATMVVRVIVTSSSSTSDFLETPLSPNLREKSRFFHQPSSTTTPKPPPTPVSYFHSFRSKGSSEDNIFSAFYRAFSQSSTSPLSFPPTDPQIMMSDSEQIERYSHPSPYNPFSRRLNFTDPQPSKVVTTIISQSTSKTVSSASANTGRPGYFRSFKRLNFPTTTTSTTTSTTETPIIFSTSTIPQRPYYTRRRRLRTRFGRKPGIFRSIPSFHTEILLRRQEDIEKENVFELPSPQPFVQLQEELSTTEKQELPSSTTVGTTSTTQKQWGEPEKVWGEPAKVWGEPAKVWGEPAKVWGVPEKNWSEPAQVWGQPEINWGLPQTVGTTTSTTTQAPEVPEVPTQEDSFDFRRQASNPEVQNLSEGGHEPPEEEDEEQKPQFLGELGEDEEEAVEESPPISTFGDKISKPGGTKFGYVLDGHDLRKYRVEERTPDGFIVGEFGVLSQNNGFLRGVRYTADGTINPNLIHKALMKFLSL